MSFITFVCIAGMVLACEAVHSEDKSEIATIKSTLNEQAAYIERLANDNAAQDLHLRNLDNENVDLKQKVIEQEKKLSNLEADNKELRKLLKATDVKNDVDSRNKRILLMNQELSNLNKPAFTARLSTHQTAIGKQQTLKFDTIESNIGNSYSPVSGVFTAPTNGTYFFYASILSHYGDYVETEIVLNGRSIALMYSYSPHHDQGSNAVVVTLKENDLVWIRHQGTEGDKVYGYNWSTFSGFQL